MFINKYTIGVRNIYFIEDDKTQILHFFAKEIRETNFEWPATIYVKIDFNDRKFYRTKLGDLVKKISKLKSFECYFIYPDEYKKNKEQLNIKE